MIVLNNLSISFPGKTLLSNINLNISDKEKVALIGKNGSGKTTLLKAIAGIYNDYAGQIVTTGKVLYLDQFRVFDAKTPFEYYLKVADTPEKERIARSILKGLGFNEKDWNRDISTFSGGERTRLHIGRIFLENPDFLLLDEPTNFLDISGIHFLKSLLRNFDGGYLIISHDRSFLRDTCNRFLEINNEKIWDFNMNFDDYLRERKNLLLHQERELKNRTREIERLKTMIERYKKWGREKSIKQAKSKEKLLEKRLKELEEKTLFLEEESGKKVKIPVPEPAGYVILEVKGASFLDVIKDISFTIYNGEKVAILGPNGSGKSTLLRLINGKIAGSGEIKFGHNVKAVFLDQFVENLNLENTVFEELASEMKMEPDYIIRAYAGRFGFKGEEVFKLVLELSGGEKQILALAKVLLKKPNLLVLDEPTNHMDLETTEILEKALREYEGSVILISHDEELIKNVCNRYFMIRNKTLHEISSLDEYDIQHEKNNRTRKSSNTFIERKRIKNKVKKIGETIDKLVQEEKELSNQLEKIDIELVKVGSDYIKAMRLTKEKENLEEKILKILEEIEKLRHQLEVLTEQL
ncbi:ATP-binding cassette, subfamily F, member 3 [Thermosipho atlanticus DSM 15807]|uniref:ATP-binding cassette, subfamily F, member 3 n=1 Tax=Thermosipho atlanticus DSM 15807 TaxID=1123380 RepID=A0A1M5TQS2_9BACT|nr:ATP-binding cassette, subfamily F, member 3 [Thermosipho atlanticus DSM 15807]